MAPMDNTEGVVSEFNSHTENEEESGHAHREREGTMDELASLLKRTREEKGISLQDVEMQTRVPTYYLQMLEGEGDPRLLAEEFYLVPFLRTYSAFLGLDPTVTIPQFIASVQKGDLFGGMSNTRPRRAKSHTVLILLLLAGLFALVVLGIVSQRG